MADGVIGFVGAEPAYPSGDNTPIVEVPTPMNVIESDSVIDAIDIDVVAETGNISEPESVESEPESVEENVQKKLPAKKTAAKKTAAKKTAANKAAAK